MRFDYQSWGPICQKLISGESVGVVDDVDVASAEIERQGKSVF